MKGEKNNVYGGSRMFLVLTRKEWRFLDFVQQIMGLAICCSWGFNWVLECRLVSISLIISVGVWRVYLSLKIVDGVVFLVFSLKRRVCLRE